VTGASRSWDWGSEWYQRRAGNLLALVRTQLRERHPTLPRYSRLYFGDIPNNIGLVAGESPAVRVWYGDTTLQAGFYSYYTPRPPQRPAGPDLFFHFDTTMGLQEVRTGPEDVHRAAQLDPGWESKHRSLAILLASHGSPREAAEEYEKLAELPKRPEALMFAAVCREFAGEQARADSLYVVAGRRIGQPPTRIAEWAAQLRATLPRR
jgi:hypothetical protein